MAPLILWGSIAVLVYTYVGYPALVALIARLRPRRTPPPGSGAPTVSLVIAAHNEEKVISDKLEETVRLRYRPGHLEVIVAADGSDDDTCSIVERFAPEGVELSFSPERRGKAPALNRAVAGARGEIVVFSDANNHLLPDAIERLVVPFVDPSVGMVSGAKQVVDGAGVADESAYWRYESAIKRAEETALGSCLGVCGELLAIRRELFEPLPEGVVNDDFYLALRVLRRGYRIAYVPEAISLEPPTPTEAEDDERRARIVAGRLDAMTRREALPWNRPAVMWGLVSHKLLRALAPVAMAGALVSSLWGSLGGRGRSRRAAGAAFGAQMVGYALAVRGARAARRRTRGDRLSSLAWFVVRSNVATARGLWRFLRGRQSPAWDRVGGRSGGPGVTGG